MKLGSRLLTAGLVAFGVLSARAQGTYEASIGARFIDLDFRGSRSQVQEYDGKLYKGAHGDVSVSNQGADGLFDLSVTDIGSTEENASLHADYKSTWKFRALYNTMHHRLNDRGSGLITNNVYFPNPSTVSLLARDQNLVMRRSEAEFSVARFAAENSARWAGFRYWSAEKVGSQAFTAASYQLGRANIDNLTQIITLDFGTDLGEDAAMALALVHADFKDRAAVVRRVGAQGNILKPSFARQNMTGAESKFRYNPRKNLFLTGAFTARQRQSLTNQFKNNIVVGAVNAAYRVSPKLNLTARMYLRANQVDENMGFRYFNDANPVNGHQLDKTALRNELVATWRPVKKVTVKGVYKLELTNRREAWNAVENYNPTAPVVWYDGSVIPANEWNNSVPNSDTRHTVTLGAKVGLPLGMEVEGSYQRLQANRAAFVGQPTWQDDANASLFVPLPAQVSFTLLGGYIQERNRHNQDRNFSAKRNTYRAALDWSASNRTFLGMDASYESIQTLFNGRFGSGGATAWYEPGMRNTQRNTTWGANGRFNAPKGVVLTTRGSYTWSKVQTPLHYWNTVLNYSVDDYSPSDVRIARGSVGVEYTPEKLKDLTARASYSVSDWVDRTDNINSGRASITQVGASMKF